MYPNLYYAFRDLFGIELGFLRIVNTFGFFVAIAFLVGAGLLSKELRRKSGLGLLQPKEEQVLVGQPATIGELLINFIGGFLLGFKLGGIATLGSDVLQDPPAYIFSGMGSPLIGILGGAALAGWKWWEKRKQQLPKPEKRTIRIWPHDRVGEFTILALIFGLLGAKLFDIFENWGDFLKHPSDYIFSPAGLTFYGGLICAAIAIIIYARKNTIPIRHLADAMAPALMIAYAVGRIGCQVAGDGDWGIYNSAYKVDAQQKVVEAAPGDYERTLQTYNGYMQGRWRESGGIPQHKSFKKPVGFLPNWFFAYQYPHNVNEDGVPIAGCSDNKYCNALPVPVFPTPLYELLAGTGLFFLLWGLRKKLKPAGALFCLYLIVNGVERFLVETIRVNTRIDSLPGNPTQAEVIAIGLVLTGLGLWIWLARKKGAKPAAV
ncbi:MAG: diacylglyceryl transferase [Chitinophagaceae bacterium]|nr:MAG: diacylglyceryl transferase [Chitinophagaceae bacterium]